MELQNNLENKAKFFAQYFGQKIQVDNELNEMGKFPLTISNISFKPEKCHLELTPLSDITDEDAIALGFINPESVRTTFFPSVGKYTTDADYLRSKGYALPYMGLSVEKLIEYGWVKLKSK